MIRGRNPQRPFLRLTSPWWRERQAHRRWVARRAQLTTMFERGDLPQDGYMQALRQAAHEYDDACTFA